MALLCLLLLQLLPLTTAIISSGSSSSDSAEVVESFSICNETQLHEKLQVLMPAIDQCSTEIGYTIQTSCLLMPSNASLQRACASGNCMQLAQELDDAGLPSCLVCVENGRNMTLKAFYRQMHSFCVNIETNQSATATSTADTSDAAGRFSYLVLSYTPTLLVLAWSLAWA